MSSNQFSVNEWNSAQEKLSIVLLDLSTSTGQPLRGGSGTVLSYSKDYIRALAPVLARGRVVVIGAASRCDVPACREKSPFCECEGSTCTRVLYRSSGPCDAVDICRVIEKEQPQGNTYVAGPIAALPSVALEEMELEQRQQSQAQALAFGMALHPRLGRRSPARVLPRELLPLVFRHLGPGTVHARVILAIDGDNNQACGRAHCKACSVGNDWNCLLQGPRGITEAVQRLLRGSDGLKINVEMNVTMVGEQGARGAGAKELAALCAATGGRYDAVEQEDDGSFLAESFHFYNETVRNPLLHVRSRMQAVKRYTELVRARQVLDCGVKTVFLGKDKRVWKSLAKEDKKREALCTRIHGTACTHGEDRGECLRAAQRKLSSSKPFAAASKSRHNRSARAALDHLSQLLECSLFIANNFKLTRQLEGDDSTATPQGSSTVPTLPSMRGLPPGESPAIPVSHSAPLQLPQIRAAHRQPQAAACRNSHPARTLPRI